jgi:hypothetical protein
MHDRAGILPLTVHREVQAAFLGGRIATDMATVGVEQRQSRGVKRTH